jgi:hypothetical protein
MFEQKGEEPTGYQLLSFFTKRNGIVRAIEIVEALTAATRAEDLSNAFAWVVKYFPTSHAHDALQYCRQRASELLGGVTALSNSLPDPSRALNNEVAHMMMTTEVSILNLPFGWRASSAPHTSTAGRVESAIRSLVACGGRCD